MGPVALILSTSHSVGTLDQSNAARTQPTDRGLTGLLVFIVEVALPGRSRPLTCVTGEVDLELGERLLVDDGGRMMFGSVSRVPIDQPWPAGVALPQVVRRAGEADENRESHLQRQRDEWLETARQLVDEHKLPMRLLRAEPGSGGRKVQFQFIAEGRVDFRDLVRDLARRMHARVELRQVGVRDAAVVQGGVGHCGTRLCCATWLAGFAPVSMRMAKAQGLPLNPGKISGQCGRLMCCLRYELPGGGENGNASSGSGDDGPGPNGTGCGGCRCRS